MKNMYKKSNAKVFLKGSSKYPNLHGIVNFKQLKNGVLVTLEVFNLPFKKCKNEIYGFHIHEGTKCTGNSKDEFADVGSHFSTNNCSHPYHSGDMPPIFGNDGYAYMSFFTNRFNLSEIIGKSVIIHSNTDDLTSQPSGNSGEKIACGIITY